MASLSTSLLKPKMLCYISFLISEIQKISETYSYSSLPYGPVKTFDIWHHSI